METSSVRLAGSLRWRALLVRSCVLAIGLFLGQSGSFRALASATSLLASTGQLASAPNLVRLQGGGESSPLFRPRSTIIYIPPPPIYTTNEVPQAPVQPSGTIISSPIKTSCGTFSTSSAYAVWQPTASGCGQVTASAPVLIGLLIPGQKFILPNVPYCGIGSVTFPVTANGSYVVLVDGNATITWQVVSCARVVGLSGALAFGEVQAGSTATAILHISNTGNDVLNVTGLSLPAGFTANWSGGAIPASATQDVTLTFAPGSPGSYGGSVTVLSDATSGTGAIAISGTGVPVPTRVINLSGNLTFGPVQAGSSASSVLHISNSGNQPLTVSSVDFPPGFSGNWNAGVIPVGGNQDVTVTFSPGSPGNYGGLVTVNSDATSGAGTIVILGTGVPVPARVINLSGNLTFGAVQAGSSTTAVLHISNSGNQVLTVSSLVFPAGFSGNWNNGAVPAGATQDVTVTFSPSSSGSFAGLVTVASDATSGAGTIAISGTGLPVPTRVIALSGDLAFGSVQVGFSASAVLHIANSGNQPLNVSGLSLPNGFAASWNAGSIPAGAGQDVTITFTPTAANNYTGFVSVTSDATGGLGNIAISGLGMLAPPTRILTTGGNLNYGSLIVGASRTSLLVLSNSGNASLTIQSISYPAGFSGDWPAGVIPAGNAQSVQVTFSPMAPVSYNGNIVIVSDATGGQSVVAVFAKGVLPSGRIIDLKGNLDFGRTRVGAAKSATLTIANDGDSSLTVSALGYPPGFGGNWLGGVIPPGASQAVQVTFNPSIPGDFGGALRILSDATGGTSSISASGTAFVLGFSAGDLQKPVNGRFHLPFLGEAGKVCIVEASEDLRTWTEITRLPGTDYASYDDLLPAGSIHRYYRFREE